ncbi:hypothetical protein J42TS3_31390 [Paenibacillus vini]|uniref:Uncharacterized protein n=1 Tax=Paenibacillus vini TaxID=1476024 RepID=A0ABQ4MDM3_9BACL|nr:hypothetical protein J42TS3_31390 [Paenibacillus vini]
MPGILNNLFKFNKHSVTQYGEAECLLLHSKKNTKKVLQGILVFGILNLVAASERN